MKVTVNIPPVPVMNDFVTEEFQAYPEKYDAALEAWKEVCQDIVEASHDDEDYD